ncbi:MAG: hypothetical protein D6805_02350, partial [Planctomycetota bacterium]
VWNLFLKKVPKRRVFRKSENLFSKKGFRKNVKGVFRGKIFPLKYEKFLGGGGRGNTFFKKGSPYGSKVFGGLEPFFEKGSEKKSF